MNQNITEVLHLSVSDDKRGNAQASLYRKLRDEIKHPLIELNGCSFDNGMLPVFYVYILDEERQIIRNKMIEEKLENGKYVARIVDFAFS